jgi:perosamine synthetase
MRIPQMIPYFDHLERDAITDYMNSNPFLTEFKKTSDLEQLICNFTNSKNAIVVSNGTMSLVAMMAAIGIGPGDKVYVPNYTMIATINAVKMIGAEPILVDVEPETLCIDLESIQKPIPPEAKAIIFVSANGRETNKGPADVLKFANDNDLILLEDAAQSLGSLYSDGQHHGTKGLLGSFSFSVPKIITMGQGGCIVTNDDKIAAKVRTYKDFGRLQGGTDFHPNFGINLKVTDLQSVIGIVQMSKLENRVVRKKAIWKRYQEKLSGNPSIHFFNQDLTWTAPWFVDILVKDRERLIRHLESKSIGTRTMYPPINQQPSVDLGGSFPVSEKVGKEGLWLPSFVQISDDEIDEVCFEINNFLS